jgi:hypothetical protein
MIERFVVGEYKQSFAVRIQSSHRIYVSRNFEEILERGLSLNRTELTQNAKRFVDDEVLQGHFLESWERKSPVRKLGLIIWMG